METPAEGPVEGGLLTWTQFVPTDGVVTLHEVAPLVVAHDEVVTPDGVSVQVVPLARLAPKP